MSKQGLDKVRNAYRAMRRAEREFYEEVQTYFRPGVPCWYRHGSYVVRCVVAQSGHSRVQVTSDSGRTYWIGTERLLQL